MVIGGESPEQAEACARAANASMAEHSVMPTPRNFTVWYTHHTGANTNLTRSIQILISNRRPFTDAVNAELYERFFTSSHENAAVREGVHRVQQILGQLLDFVTDVDKNATTYNAALREISSGIEEVAVTGGSGSVDLGPIASLVSRLIEETKTMQQNTELLVSRIDNSANTISELKIKLEAVRREALTDGLTGIANRKAFEQNLNDAARDSLENGDPLTLLLLDIDHFKRFNDSWGHQMGDQALRLVAKTLVDNVKGQDVAARHGGEEFAVLLPNTSLTDAVAVGNKLREAFARRKLVKRDSGESIGTITVSIGAARYEPGESLQGFFHRADQALYAAKRSGRNRIVTEDELQTA